MPLLRRTTLRALPDASVSLASAGALLSSARAYTTFIRKVSDTLTAKVSQLAEDVWLADEKLVTEPRHKIVPQRALKQSLAERLAKQRNVKQRLVPTSIKVDKSRQYVEFTWPAEAMERMAEMVEDAAHGVEPPEATPNAPKSPEASSPTQRAAIDQQETTLADRHEPPSSSPPLVPVWSAATHQGPLRTRALAEFLRAYTPSTDGALGAKDIVIYGRRGVSIAQIIPMGNYALRFVFSDDHAGGIYSYEYLFYLTGPATKYGLMRAYVRDLQRRRKSRDPPKRAPSRRSAAEAQRAKAASLKH